MIAGTVGAPRRRAPVVCVALTFWILLQTAIVACASDTPSSLATSLREAYPSVRALVVARGACVVFEYYRRGITAETRSPIYSVTKSVLSILVGIAIDKGNLRLDEKMSELLPEASEANIDPLVREIRVRDLLTMTAGFAPNAAAEADAKIDDATARTWRLLLDRPMRDPPGSRFSYDTSEQNLLSIALTRAIKQDARRFAQRNLFGPLHIENYDWTVDADGHLIGATSLFLTARDMAKIGVLYLQQGRWGESQIVSAAFVRNSTTKQSEGGPPSNTAYGYFWWISKTSTGEDAFFAAGQNDQLVYVVPRRDLVVALAAESIPGGGTRLLNDVVLPAAGEKSAPCLARLAPASPE